MGNFKRNDRFGGRGKGGGYRDRKPGRSDMHKATCHDCGKSCEVPFKPTGSKPVFCSECFEKKGSSSSGKFDRKHDRPRFSKDRPEKSFYHSNKQLERIIEKLDEILGALIVKTPTAFPAKVSTKKTTVRKVKTTKTIKAPKPQKATKSKVKKADTPKKLVKVKVKKKVALKKSKKV